MKYYLGIFCLGLAIVVSGCSQAKTDTEYLQAANAFYQQGSLNEATIELKNALQTNALSADARYLLGKIYLESGDSASALKELQQAQDLGSTQSAIPLIAKALLNQGEYEPVLALAESGLSPENQQGVMVAKGMAQLALGNKKAAAAAFDQVMADNSESTFALLGLARLNLADGDLDSARAILNDIHAIDENDGAAWSLLGDIEQAAGNLELSEEAYTKAIAVKKNDFDEVLSRAVVRISANKIDLAEQDLKALPEALLKHPGVNYAKGLIYLQRQDYDAAQTAFESVLNTTDDYIPALFYSGLSHFSLNQFDQAEDQLDRYIAKIPGYPPANRMLAIIKSQRGEYKEAEDLLKKAISDGAVDETLVVLLAETLVAQNKLKEAVDILTTQVENNPDSVSSKVALAKGLARSEKISSAIDVLLKALVQQPDHLQANAQLVGLYQIGGQSAEALQAAKQFVKISDGSTNANNLLATTYLSQGNDDLARDTFQKVLDQSKTDYSAHGGLAALAVKSGDFATALQHYEKILETLPDNLQILMNIADVYMAQKDKASARNVIEQAVESSPSALKPRIRLGWFYTQSNEYDKIPALLSGFEKSNYNDVPLLLLLADSTYNLKQFSKAEKYLLRLRDVQPDNAGVAYSLAKTYAALKKNFDYLETLKTVIELKPEYVPARIDLANYLVVLDQVDEAQEHVDFLNQSVKGGAEVLLLEGKIAEKKGDYPAAVSAYKPIFEYTKNNINLLRLVLAQWNAGDQGQAVAMLESWLNEYPADIMVQLELANRYILLDRNSEAAGLYKAVIKEMPDNVRALNNLAFLLKDTENSRAIKYAEKAYELQSQSGAIMDTLAQVLTVRGGKKDLQRAERLLDNAKQAESGQ